MLSRIGNTISLLAILVATSAVAQQPTNEKFPHIPSMAHEVMTHNGKVVYEAYVDQNDPNPKPFFLQVKVDTLSGTCASTVGHVVGAASHDPGTKGNGSSAFISCVVTELSQDGQAKAEIVYEIQDQARKVSKSGHVKANLQVGKTYKTASNGSEVTLFMQTY